MIKPGLVSGGQSDIQVPIHTGEINVYQLFDSRVTDVDAPDCAEQPEDNQDY
jgi:hypothetical protein